MTIEGIKEELKTPSYDFLRENPHLGSNIVLLGLGGSYAYGTNTETSDIDTRGIALNSKKEILLGTDFEQVVEPNTDTTIYSFRKMMNLLANCNPNTIEILGLKPEHYLYISPIGQEILDNKKIFLSQKAVQSFGGYANQQLYRLNQKAKHALHQSELEVHIGKTINRMLDDFHTRYTPFDDDNLSIYVDKSDREDYETELYLDLKLTHYPLRDWCSMWNEMQNCVTSYNKIGKRNSHAIEHGKIAKHMMHLVMLFYKCFDILEREEIVTYREKEHDELMEIRGGKFLTEDNQVVPEFFEFIKTLEDRLEYDKKNTSLPVLPDYDKINDFSMSVYERIVKAS
jgi:hypothetical protein